MRNSRKTVFLDVGYARWFLGCLSWERSLLRAAGYFWGRQVFRLAPLLLVFPTLALTSDTPQSFTYQGRLMNSVGTAPLLDFVDLRFSIYDPSGTCLLYEESQKNINLMASNGFFRLQVGSFPSSTQRTEDDPRLSMKQVFSNEVSSQQSPRVNCPSGYTPLSGDSRRLRITVTPQLTAIPSTLTPDVVIGSQASVSITQSLQGLEAKDLIRVAASPSFQGNVSLATLSVLTSAEDASALHHHDSVYLKKSSLIDLNSGVATAFTVGSLGVGLVVPTADISLGGASDRIIQVQRNSSPGGPGRSLTFSAGGATSGSTNQAGGSLILSSGSSTGSAGSQIEFKTSNGGPAGSSDQFSSTQMILTGSGKLSLGHFTPQSQFQVSSSSASGRGQIIRGASATNASLLELQDSLGNALFSVNPSGYFSLAGAPTQATHAATKQYFDDQLTTALGSLSGVPQFNGRTGAVMLQGSDVLAALGYTPVSPIGDTLSGELSLAAGSTTSTLGAVSQDYVDVRVLGKQDLGSYLTGLSGDLTAVGPGSVSASIQSLGGVLSSQVASSVSQVLSATAGSSSGTLVTRDSFGNLNVASVTAQLIGDVLGTIIGTLTGNVTGSASLNVLKSGDTLSGELVLSGDPQENLGAATKAYVDLIFNTKQAPLGFTPVNRAGDTLSGSLLLSGNQTLRLGVYSSAEEAILVAGLTSSDRGKIWYNSNSNLIKYWNGSQVQSLGAAGAGLQTLNGLSVSNQGVNLTASGSGPSWSSSGSTHTLGVPLAQTGSVTAGLLSNADYVNFSNKQPALGYTPVSRLSDTMSGLLSLPSSGLSVGTNQLVVSGGNLGVGVTSPIDALVASGNVVFPWRMKGTGSSLSLLTSMPTGPEQYTLMFWDGKKGSLFSGRASGFNLSFYSPGDIGQGSAAFGVASRVSGNQTVAFGNGHWIDSFSSDSFASGRYGSTLSDAQGSAAFGEGEDINGAYNVFAAGQYNEMTSQAGFAVNGYNIVSGDYGFVSGKFNTSQEYASFIAGGEEDRALGRYSFSTGRGNYYSASYAQFTLGQYSRKTGTENPNASVSTDPVFVVGNGLGYGLDPSRPTFSATDPPSNAVMVLKNGNVGIGSDSPLARLEVIGTVSATTFVGSFSGNSTTATTANQLEGGGVGSLPYQSGDNATLMLALGSVGHVLTSSGTAPQWSTALGASSGGTGFSSYSGGDLISASSASNLSRLSIGSNGQALVVSSGSPSWGELNSSGEVTGNLASTSISGSAVLGKTLLGYSSSSGALSSLDSILTAIGKLDGNTTTRVSKSGDSMSGGLLLASVTPALNLQATNKQYVDAAVLGISTGVSSLQSRVGAVYLTASDVSSGLGYTPIGTSGGTMTGPLQLPSNGLTVGTNQLLVSGGRLGVGVASPSDALMVNGNLVIPYRTKDTGPSLVFPNYSGSSGDLTEMFWDGKKGSFFAGEAWGLVNFSQLNYYSTTFGYDSYALGPGSFVVGESSEAENYENTFTYGKYSHAYGENSFAGGYYSYADSATDALSIGYEVGAFGNYSAAFNAWAYSSGNDSSSFGNENYAGDSYAQFSIGYWSRNGYGYVSGNQWISTVDATQFVPTDPIFTISNDTALGAMEILKNGNVGIGLRSAPVKIAVAGTVSATTFIGTLSGNTLTASQGTNLSGGATGSIPYQTGVGTTSMLGLSASGSVLTSTLSMPQWSSSLGVSGGGTGLNSYSAGDLIVASASSSFSKLGIGSDGQALIVSSGSPSWGGLSLSGEVTGTLASTSISGVAVLGKTLLGFSSNAGTLSASESILSALGKLDGNVATRVSKSGDSMTGNLILSSESPTLNLQAATKQYVDSAVLGVQPGIASFNGQVGAVTLESSAVTGVLGYSPLNRAGDLMTGPLALPASGLRVGTTDLVLASGAVGIGVASPSDALTVGGNWVVPYRDWDTGGSVSLSNYAGGGVDDLTATFWDGKKGAFFAGEVVSAALTPSAMGYASATFGRDSKALGYSSFASGAGSQAVSDYSFASGFGNTASVEVNYGNDQFSFVVGRNNFANIDYSFVTGRDNQASDSIGEGYSAIALGRGNSVSRFIPIAIGLNNQATNYWGFAAGSNNSATAYESYALGVGNSASRYPSVAIGLSNQGTGDGATAIGSRNTSSGYDSFAAGLGNESKAYAQSAVGTYNQLKGGETVNTWVGTAPIFTVGNGSTSASRSNALMILKNGNIGVGTNSPAHRLVVNGAVSATAWMGSLSGNATTATTATNLSSGLAGSLPYQTAGAATAMLGIGASGRVLTSSGSSAPQWSASLGVSSGGTGITSYAAGDLIVATGASVLSKLGIGSNGQALVVSIGSLSWGSPESFSGTLSGDVTGTQSATTIADSVVTGKLLTGFSSTTGALSALDTVLGALGKLDGNIALLASRSGDTMSGALAVPSNGLIVGTNQLAISGGNLGIGTSTPGAALTINGRFRADGGQIAGAFATNSTGTINFDAGNIQTTSVAAGTLSVSTGTMNDGGAYTLAFNNSTGGNYTFSSSGMTFKCNPACPLVVTPGKDTVATLIKAGSTVYVSWVQDFE
ncbi:MAG: hypothetical protein ACO3A2_05505 [Bdellovibrionia bacterium]